MARKYWHGVDPIGTRIRLVAPHQEPGPWRTVVGVVNDFRQYNIDTPPRPEMFSPTKELKEMTLVVKTSQDPLSAVPTVRKALAQVDKDQPLSDIQTLQQMIDYSISQRRFNMLLLSGFAILSTILALAGVLASCATSYRLVLEILGSGWLWAPNAAKSLPGCLAMAGIGVVAGVGIAFLSKSLIEKLLFGIGPLESRKLSDRAFIHPAACLTHVNACRQANCTDRPSTALRHE